MNKYTDEELSRILSCHSVKKLEVGGNDTCGGGCIEQVALVASTEDVFPGILDRLDWFDLNYRGRWSADRLLGALEDKGLA